MTGENYIVSPSTQISLWARIPQTYPKHLLAHEETYDLWRERAKTGNNPAAAAKIEYHPKMWDLSPDEHRIAHAIQTEYSRHGITENGSYANARIPEDVGRLMDISGVPRSGEMSVRWRRAYGDLVADPSAGSAGRQVQIFVWLENADGTYSGIVDTEPLVKRVPYYPDLAPEERDALMLTDDLPEPEVWLLELPRGMREGLHRHWRNVPVDLPARLAEAAEKVGGERRGTYSRDWKLAYWYLLQRPQPWPRDEPSEYVVFVNRAVLIPCFPTLRKANEAHRRGRVEKRLEQGYRILVEAGLIRDFRLNQKLQAGTRDILIADPGSNYQIQNDPHQLCLTGSP